MAERKLATVEEILALEPIENADALELATVRGWKVVVRKDEFSVGDIVVYFEIDSFFPESLLEVPVFSFLKDRGTRPMNDPEDEKKRIYGHALRTIKLRGQISQGLVLPVEDFGDWHIATAPAGTDLTDALGVLKYEPYVKPQNGPRKLYTFPTQYAVKSDAERVQNLSPRQWDALHAVPGKWTPTVKIDGCLKRDTPVKMWDGSRKYIQNIIVGDVVLGFDHETNSICPSKVLGTAINGRTDTWYRIRGKKLGTGIGGSVFSVKATENHPFWVTNKGYVRADELVVGDELLCTHSIITPTKTQESIILGIILGDGSVSSHKQITYSHSEKQTEYHDWINKALGPIVRGTTYQKSGYGSNMQRTTLARMYGLDLSEWDKANGVVPKSIIDKMNPITMAFWYMDDGSLSHSESQEDRLCLSTHSFNDESQEILQTALAKFGIDSTIQDSSKGKFIRVNAESADLFFALIAPYVPPSMQYKLPSYYRGNTGWIPEHTEGYRTKVVPVTVESVQSDYHYMNKCRNGEIKPMRQAKYDIETETHNFFACDILVHNSSMTVWRDESNAIRVASRNFELVDDESHFSQYVIDNYDMFDEALSPGVAIQGELYGPGIQGNKLGVKEVSFAPFNVFARSQTDLLVVPKHRWNLHFGLNSPLIDMAVPELDLPFPETIKEAVAQANDLRYANGSQAEGIVYHNSHPEVAKILGRNCFKSINNIFLSKYEK